MSEPWEKQVVYGNLVDYVDENKLRWKLEAAEKKAKDQANGTVPS